MPRPCARRRAHGRGLVGRWRLPGRCGREATAAGGRSGRAGHFDQLRETADRRYGGPPVDPVGDAAGPGPRRARSGGPQRRRGRTRRNGWPARRGRWGPRGASGRRTSRRSGRRIHRRRGGSTARREGPGPGPRPWSTACRPCGPLAAGPIRSRRHRPAHRCPPVQNPDPVVRRAAGMHCRGVSDLWGRGPLTSRPVRGGPPGSEARTAVASDGRSPRASRHFGARAMERRRWDRDRRGGVRHGRRRRGWVRRPRC